MEHSHQDFLSWDSDFAEISIVNLITYKRYKYLRNKASIKSKKYHNPMRVETHMYFFQIRIVWPCLAIAADPLNRYLEILLRSLLCIWFIKVKELSVFHTSNSKDGQYQRFSDAWGKCTAKHAANVASKCWFNMDVINIES